MNNDLISRVALKKALYDFLSENSTICDWDDIFNVIDNAPAVELLPENVIETHTKIGYDRGFNDGYAKCVEDNERPQVVLFAENITEEEKQKLIAEIKSVMDNAKFTEEPERPKGEWITESKLYGGFGDSVLAITCSICKESFVYRGTKHNFCPNCGAKMKGGAE